MVLGNFILPHWKSLWIPFFQVSNFILQSTKYLKEILEECFTARRIAGLPICKVTYFYLYFLKIRFVGMIEDFGRLLMQQPVPVFVLLGFHFLIKASVVICFVHSEHLLQNRNSRLISFENQAAMYAIFSSANWKLPGSRHALC